MLFIFLKFLKNGFRETISFVLCYMVVNDLICNVQIILLLNFFFILDFQGLLQGKHALRVFSYDRYLET